MGAGLGRSAVLSPKIRLDGKTAIITGCNTGIGKCTAADFFRRGCRVVMACRNATKAEEARRDIMEKTPGASGELIVRKLDLSSLRSVRAFAEEVLAAETAIHVLVNNAGVMMCPKSRTEDGFEMQFGTNHLGHFLLTLLLLDRMVASSPARIVNVTSSAHKVGEIDFEDLNWERRTYSPVAAYGRSKLANVLFTVELAKRLEGTGVNVYAVHPGIVRTELGRHLDNVYFPGFRVAYRTCFGWMFKSAEEGALTTIHCAASPEVAEDSGLYYKDCGIAESVHPEPDVARKLWDVSRNLVGLG